MKTIVNSRVSIIVPVYNTSVPYLRECFNSVLMQDYEDIELVVVNDGSTERETVAFLEEYASRNANVFKYYSFENGGVSLARERGLDKATGSRVMFLDSDDCLMEGAVTRLVNVMDEHGVDAVIGEDYVRENIDNQIRYEGKDILKALLENKEASFGWALWAKLFDTALMREVYKARPDVFYGEDLLVNADYFAKADNCIIINEQVYMYRTDNPDSAMKQAKSVKKLSLIKMWREMADIYEREGLNEEATRIKANYYDSLLSGYLQCEYYRYDNYRELKAQIKAEMRAVYKDIMANPYVSGKRRYWVALNALWVFKCKHALTR